MMPLFALMRSPPVCHRSASSIMGAILFEPTRWDPSGSVVFAEQPPRLCHVGSQFAVCLSLGGLVEEPHTCTRRKTILALEEDRYAHGRTQLAVGHHRDELVPQLDLVEGLDETVAVVDPTPAESRKRITRFKAVPYLPSAKRTSSAVLATIGPDKSI